MEFRLDSGQVELQQTVARFCADRFPLDTVAEREGAPVDRARWDEMAALGVFGSLLVESAGGSGLGLVDGALLFEQLGSHLVPGPVLWTVLGAPLVDGAAAGERLVGGWTPRPSSPVRRWSSMPATSTWSWSSATRA
jgi:alkylation response protein AidB-like acyl-CoA dehydrogenase